MPPIAGPVRLNRKDMKVVIIHPPEPIVSIASKVIQHPINLAQLAAYLNQFEIECEIWDYGVEPYSDSEFQTRLADFRPPIVGFSCVTPLIKTGAAMARLVKEVSSDTLTVIGGPHVTAIPEKTLTEFPSFDLGVIGEGEITFHEIITKLEAGKSLTGIPGTVFREGKETALADLRPLIQNLDDLPFPNRDLINFAGYAGSSSPGLSNKTHTITQMFTSRGCPVWCIFCGSHLTHRGKVRFRSAQHVLAEARECIEKYQVDHLTIDDDTFTYGKKRLLEICEGMKELPVTWDCDSRVDSITPETLIKMAESGCVKIAYGVESGSPRILKLIRKRITLEQISNAFRWAKKVGIQTSGFLMIGSHPTESIEDLDQTIRFMKRIKPDYLMIYCAVPYPGTELNRIMTENNLILSEDWDEYDIVRTRPVWKTNCFSPEELVRQQQRLYRSFYLRPGFILKKTLELKSWDDFKYIFESGVAFLRYIFSRKRLKDQST